MSKTTKSVRSLRDELEHCRTALAVERSNAHSKVWRALIQWGAIVFIAYFCFRAVRDLAGKKTLANINFHHPFLGLLDMGRTLVASSGAVGPLGLMFGTGGILYGLFQRKLRRDVIKKYYHYIERDQKALDKDRTSSLLMPEGGTRPEDV